MSTQCTKKEEINDKQGDETKARNRRRVYARPGNSDSYKNAGGNIELHQALAEMMNRGKSMPGGACGFWGACGAGISTGMFVSIISNSTPLVVEPFGRYHLMTAKALEQIGTVGDPRCCKRDSFLSILAAVDFVEQHFQVSMEKAEVVCDYSTQNNQCIGMRCPFR